jgi:hypothetical protein
MTPSLDDLDSILNPHGVHRHMLGPRLLKIDGDHGSLRPWGDGVILAMAGGDHKLRDTLVRRGILKRVEGGDMLMRLPCEEEIGLLCKLVGIRSWS